MDPLRIHSISSRIDLCNLVGKGAGVLRGGWP